MVGNPLPIDSMQFFDRNMLLDTTHNFGVNSLTCKAVVAYLLGNQTKNNVYCSCAFCRISGYKNANLVFMVLPVF